MGIRATTTHAVVLPDEAIGTVQAGDWEILSGRIVIGTLKDKDFPGPYEIVAEGTLILSVRDREAIEAVTGLGSTRTALDLLAGVQRLARIKMGDVTIPFTPGQLEEIAYRAQKRGISVQRAMQEVVDRIKDELFHRS